jgi:translation initiation factor eIF-2B subunit delta
MYVYLYMFTTSSSLLQRILVEAHGSGTKFRVVVVDGRPWREGREMLRRLVECGLDCSYILVSAASFIMREVCNVKCQEQLFIFNQLTGCCVSLTTLCHFNS